MQHAFDLIALLGRAAATKTAGFLLPPPRKRTPASAAQRGRTDLSALDDAGRSSQAPHRYGVTRRRDDETPT